MAGNVVISMQMDEASFEVEIDAAVGRQMGELFFLAYNDDSTIDASALDDQTLVDFVGLRMVRYVRETAHAEKMAQIAAATKQVADAEYREAVDGAYTITTGGAPAPAGMAL